MPSTSFPINGLLGTLQLGPVAVPQGFTRATLALNGSSMGNPALRATVVLDFSLDGGLSWASENRGPLTDPYPVTMELQGGATDRRGGPLAVYNLSAALPDPTNPSRKIRGTVVVTGAPLTTQATLTVE